MVAWRWFVDGCCRLMWWLVWGSRFVVVGCWLGIVGLGVDGLPKAVLSFRPSASLHPPRCASLAGTRLRPRVARVLRTTPLSALHIHSFPLLAAPLPLRCMFDGWDRKQYCPSDLPLRSIPPAALRLRVPAYGRGFTVRDHRLAYGLGPSAFARMAFFK